MKNIIQYVLHIGNSMLLQSHMIGLGFHDQLEMLKQNYTDFKKSWIWFQPFILPIAVVCIPNHRPKIPSLVRLRVQWKGRHSFLCAEQMCLIFTVNNQLYVLVGFHSSMLYLTGLNTVYKLQITCSTSTCPEIKEIKSSFLTLLHFY